MAIGVEDKGQDVEVRSGSLSVVKKIEDTVKTDIVSGEVLATVGTVEQVKSGSIEVTGGTVNTQIDNLNYAGTVNVVNSIANPVTSDVGSGTRPTSLDTDNVGLFKTTDFTESRTISTDNVGLAKDTTLKSGTVNAIDSINQIKSGSIEVTGGTVNTQIDNLNYAGTVNVVNSIANPVTSDVGSGTRPTSVDVDNVGLFKSGQDIGNAGTVAQVDERGNLRQSDMALHSGSIAAGGYAGTINQSGFRTVTLQINNGGTVSTNMIAEIKSQSGNWFTGGTQTVKAGQDFLWTQQHSGAKLRIKSSSNLSSLTVDVSKRT